MINVRKVKAAGLCDCCDKKKATYEVYCRISLGSFLSQALTKATRYTYVNHVLKSFPEKSLNSYRMKVIECLRKKELLQKVQYFFLFTTGTTRRKSPY